MPTVFTMTSGAWGAVRFAPSWLWETMLAVRTLSVRHHQAAHQPWLAAVDREVVGAAAPALVALIPRAAWTPDFLSPPGSPTARTFADQLLAVRQTAVTDVAAELARSLAHRPSRSRMTILAPLVEDPASARDELADQLQAAYELLVAPWSGRLTHLLDTEVRRRGEIAAQHGMVAAVSGVHPTVTARAGEVRSAHTDDVTLRCRELVLLPSVFSWPFPTAVVDTATPALAYPVPGVATVWEEPTRAPDVTARLLGRRRADVLAATAEPATTSDLAARLQLAASTVSEHLAVLRDGGLVSAERRARIVLYRQTAAGTAMATRPAGTVALRVDGV